ncbi:MAG: RDD family protein [Candidatus Aenigmarchaeota archaeon]|nr:RDD family protein [Candidatus Aenigmarchaeota archaeon]
MQPKPIKGTESDVIGHRIAAIVIDWIILGIVSLFILGVTFFSAFAAGTLATGSTATGGMFSFLSFIFAIFVVVIINFLYGFVLEGWRGQTIGKMALGIIVVREDGKPCGYLSAFARNILRFIDALPFLYILGLIVIAVTNRRQRIGDLLAKTVVVRVKK